MICSDGNVINFKTNADGFIIKARVNNGESATYKYSGKDLIYSEDSRGNSYGFEYDRNHNLTKIIYNPLREEDEKIDN